jgi:hypothetical protein
MGVFCIVLQIKSVLGAHQMWRAARDLKRVRHSVYNVMTSLQIIDFKERDIHCIVSL